MACSICKKLDDDAINYGDFMTNKEIKVHYYCLLLSTHLAQNGKDLSGILGFLLKDIKKFIRQRLGEKCIYCKKMAATVMCCKCNCYFHNICGNRNNCISQFVGEFRSYCHKHVDITYDQCHVQTEACSICSEPMGEYNPATSIGSDCCREFNMWAHRSCMRKFALGAGYYLRCIWCRNQAFRDDIRLKGIFVPDRDASWEGKNAYSYLHKRQFQCNSKDCKCPSGINYQDYNKWIPIVCKSCGAVGIHKYCSKMLNIDHTNFQCEECHEVFNRTCNIGIASQSALATNLNLTLYMTKNDFLVQVPNGPLTLHNICLSPKQARKTQKDRGPLLELYIRDEKEDVYIAQVKAYLKDPTNIGKDAYTKEELDIVEYNEGKLPDWLDKIIAEFKKEVNVGPPVTVESESEDTDASAEDLLNKMAKVDNVRVPKPMSK